MAVRLNKALKELNVGINTVAEFLQKKGMALEDASPNAKITDEQYGLLRDAFGKDKDMHAETQLDIQKRKEKERQERDERREKERKEKERQEQEVFRLKSSQKPQFKIVGNINDNQPKDESKPVVEEPAVKEVGPVKVETVETPAVEAVKVEEVVKEEPVEVVEKVVQET